MAGLMSAGSGEIFVEKIYFASSANYFYTTIQELPNKQYKVIPSSQSSTDIVKINVSRSGYYGQVVDFKALKSCEVECVYTNYKKVNTDTSYFTKIGRVEKDENIIPTISTPYDANLLLAKITIKRIYE